MLYIVFSIVNQQNRVFLQIDEFKLKVVLQFAKILRNFWKSRECSFINEYYMSYVLKYLSGNGQIKTFVLL